MNNLLFCFPCVLRKAGLDNARQPWYNGVVGWTDPTTKGAIRLAVNAVPLADAVLKAGGFTYHPITGSVPTNGFAVSPFPQYEEVYPIRKFTDQTIKDYILRHMGVFRKHPKAHVGGWVDNGMVYLDISIVVETHEEAQAICAEFKQKAYYDLAAGQTIDMRATTPAPVLV